MILTSLDEVRPGMMLGAGVHNAEGQTLLGPDVPLTAAYIERLDALGCATVWIDDEDTRDIPFDHLLSEETRLTAAAHVQRIFALATREGPALASVALHDVQPLLRRFQQAIKDDPAIEHLLDVADAIVREATGRQVLLGLGTLRSHETAALHHGVDVAAAAAVIGRVIGYDAQSLKKLVVGCLLHDVGKIFAEDAGLAWHARHDPDAELRRREHPVFAYLMLSQSATLGLQAAHVAYQHHEHQDGTGYPRRLTGTNRVRRGPEIHQPGLITPLAEIAALADFYDSRSTDRSYRRARPHDQVWRMVQRGAGTHFNREVAELFLSILPPFPLGTRVVVTSGRWHRHTGVVVRFDRRAMDRPVIRILADELGQRLEAFELDLTRDEAAISGLGSHVQAPRLTPEYPQFQDDAALEDSRPAAPTT